MIHAGARYPKNRRILVVDDDRDLRESVMEALEDEGYSVAAAPDGMRALAYLRGPSPKPDLILLDLAMPNMNGDKFREEQLKSAELAAIPVAIVTAESNASDKASSLQASGFIRKPLKIGALLELVGRILKTV